MRLVLHLLEIGTLWIGSMALVVGMIMLFLKKGNQRHAFLGRIYFYSVIIAASSSLPGSYLFNNFFLFTLALFTLYLALTGRRYAHKITRLEISNFDWVLTSCLIIFGMGFFAYSVYHIIQGTRFGYIFLCFGLWSIFLTHQDFKCFHGLYPTQEYIRRLHLQRMICSYITAWTYVVIVYLPFVPLQYTWFLPILVLLPIIFYWNIRKKNSING